MTGVNESDQVEIKIMTMDHQTYTIHTGKSVPVPTLKKQIAQVTGVVSGHQQLLCGGKFLKDDQNLSTYNVEDGHTFHLIVRKTTDSSLESTEPQISDSFLTSMETFDRMMEEYHTNFSDDERPSRRFFLDTRNLIEDVESYNQDRVDYLKRVRVLETARQILFGIMLRRASQGPQLSRLRTGLVLVQNLLHDAKLSLRAIESGCESMEEALVMAKMLEHITSENGGPGNNNIPSISPSSRNRLSVSFQRFFPFFSSNTGV